MTRFAGLPIRNEPIMRRGRAPEYLGGWSESSDVNWSVHNVMYS